MPSKLFGTLRKTSAVFRSLEKAYVCPSCAFKRPSKAPTRFPQQRRHASTLASSTAINATKDIAPHLKDLYTKLEGLEKHATNYIDLSRLQLALRGLESRRPVIRLAVLGLHDQKSARRLVRLLLADALTSEADWEKQLNENAEDDQKSILLKYGEENDMQPSGALLHTICAPSLTLEKHNVEIIISSLNLSSVPVTDATNTESFRRMALVPMAETPRTFSGQVSWMRYPVHRALIIADGLQGCLEVGKLSDSMGDTDTSLKFALNIPAYSRVEENELSMAVVDVDKAGHALKEFRQSLENAIIYEQGWFQSGMPVVVKWLASSSSTSHTHINVALRELVTDILNSAKRNIVLEESSKSKELLAPGIHNNVKQPLNESLDMWAMRGHMELRDQLDVAFRGDKWAKLAWYKLFWRVDDVSMLVSDLLERHWLVDSERSMIWLAGRAAEAGILGKESATLQTLAETQSAVAARQDVNSAWPMRISLARAIIEASAVPNLHGLAQSLLMSTISIGTVSSALSALIYIAFPATSLVSAAAPAALGIMLALRRMQSRWELARSSWESELREEGRRVLKASEETVRAAIMQGPKRGLEDIAMLEDRRLARVAVEEARQALEEIKSNNA